MDMQRRKAIRVYARPSQPKPARAAGANPRQPRISSRRGRTAWRLSQQPVEKAHGAVTGAEPQRHGGARHWQQGSGQGRSLSGAAHHRPMRASAELDLHGHPPHLAPLTPVAEPVVLAAPRRKRLRPHSPNAAVSFCGPPVTAHSRTLFPLSSYSATISLFLAVRILSLTVKLHSSCSFVLWRADVGHDDAGCAPKPCAAPPLQGTAAQSAPCLRCTAC